MPLYKVKAVNMSGVKLSETMEAHDINSLKSQLREKGLIPLEISDVKERKGLLTRINDKDILFFTQELSSLLDAGLPLDRALGILREHTTKRKMKEIIDKIIRDIEKGRSFSQAISVYPEFSDVYVNIIRASEAGGTLEESLRRLTRFYEVNISAREEIKGALIYPMLLTCVGIIAVGIIVFYVIPRFEKMFYELGAAIPLTTEMVFSISRLLSGYWWLILVLMISSITGLRYYAMKPEGRLLWDKIRLRIPFLREIFMRIAISRFLRTLGSLLEGGVPLLDALRLSRDVTGNRVISERLAPLEEGVRKGRGLSAPLKELNVFPPLIVEMIAVGEEAGKMEETFINIAERYEAETRELIKRSVRLFEPIMIVVMGSIVAFIVISILLAIFSVNEMSL